MSASAESIVQKALAEKGKQYVFGVTAKVSDPSPAAFDCSELVLWACAQVGLQPPMKDGTWAQHLHCRNAGKMLSVDAAIDTRARCSSTTATRMGRRPRTCPAAPAPLTSPSRLATENHRSNGHRLGCVHRQRQRS